MVRFCCDKVIDTIGWKVEILQQIAVKI